jgi:hypothetical protein
VIGTAQVSPYPRRRGWGSPADRRRWPEAGAASACARPPSAAGRRRRVLCGTDARDYIVPTLDIVRMGNRTSTATGAYFPNEVVKTIEGRIGQCRGSSQVMSSGAGEFLGRLITNPRDEDQQNGADARPCKRQRRCLGTANPDTRLHVLGPGGGAVVAAFATRSRRFTGCRGRRKPPLGL